MPTGARGSRRRAVASIWLQDGRVSPIDRRGSGDRRRLLDRRRGNATCGSAGSAAGSRTCARPTRLDGDGLHAGRRAGAEQRLRGAPESRRHGVGRHAERRRQPVQRRPVHDLHDRRRPRVEHDLVDRRRPGRNDVVWHAEWRECLRARSMAELIREGRTAVERRRLPDRRRGRRRVGRNGERSGVRERWASRSAEESCRPSSREPIAGLAADERGSIWIATSNHVAACPSREAPARRAHRMPMCDRTACPTDCTASKASGVTDRSSPMPRPDLVLARPRALDDRPRVRGGRIGAGDRARRVRVGRRHARRSARRGSDPGGPAAADVHLRRPESVRARARAVPLSARRLRRRLERARHHAFDGLHESRSRPVPLSRHGVEQRRSSGAAPKPPSASRSLRVSGRRPGFSSAAWSRSCSDRPASTASACTRSRAGSTSGSRSGWRSGRASRRICTTRCCRVWSARRCSCTSPPTMCRPIHRRGRRSIACSQLMGTGHRRGPQRRARSALAGGWRRRSRAGVLPDAAGARGRGQVDFRVIVEGRPRPLHPLIRDEVYRIGREALVNAVRHSGGQKIEVEIEYAAAHVRRARSRRWARHRRAGAARGPRRALGARRACASAPNASAPGSRCGAAPAPAPRSS